MFEFTLYKSLFFELDKYKMDGVTETKEKQITRRRLEVCYDNVPSVTSIAAEERILPYVDRYYFFINDETYPADIKDPDVKQVIYEFYKDHFPSYLKEGIPEDMTDQNILECFEVFNMPDYRPKHAFPGLITLEDIRNGNIHDEDKPRFSFPGLELIKGGKWGSKGEDNDDPDKPQEPSFAELGGYTALNGDREGASNKIEELKKQFASELKALKADEIEIPDEKKLAELAAKPVE